MRSPTGSSHNNDEWAPLLQTQSDNNIPHTTTPRTPLPTAQIFILLLPWSAEATVFYSISPYINQLVRDLPIVGGDGMNVGYYTGIIMSLHFATEAVSALYWNRLSDYVGRKPVLLFCLAGTATSIVLFGLSRSLWPIIFSRCLHGALKGHIGVVRSMMAELTDETNRARGYSFFLLAWSLGSMIGPLIGGTLSRPQDRWPRLFSHTFWAKYPYFLPCAVAAAYCFVCLVMVAVFLKETVIHPHSPARIEPDTSQEELWDIVDAPLKDVENPPPLRSLLTRPVLTTLVNYATFSFLDMASDSLIPLIWSTPVESGGLSFSPVSIGFWMSVYGCMSSIFQFAAFPRIVRLFGLRSVFVASTALCVLIFAMFPLENLVLRHAIGGPSMVIWLLILLQLGSLSIHKMGFGAVFMYISSAAPDKRSLGALNGLAQTVASVQRAFGPATADSLFAFSVTNNILCGNFVYGVLIILVFIGLCVAVKLPKHAWTPREM